LDDEAAGGTVTPERWQKIARRIRVQTELGRSIKKDKRTGGSVSRRQAEAPKRTFARIAFESRREYDFSDAASLLTWSGWDSQITR
jgi:hypothetical protein